jgi:RNA polymerase sigma-70 factor (ECF subfamily)
LKVTIEQLIEDCKKGNQQACRKLYEMYERRFYALSFRYARTTADAEDITIQGFTKIFKNINAYENGNFEGWMKTIIIHEALSFYRKDQRQIWGYTTETDPNMKGDDLSAFDQLSMEDLKNLISTLPEGCRIIFNLFAIEGYSHSEIAELLGLSEGTSKSQFSRAKTLLREKLIKQEI